MSTDRASQRARDWDKMLSVASAARSLLAQVASRRRRLRAALSTVFALALLWHA